MNMSPDASAKQLSVVVTGGASGIGAAVCRRVVDGGGHVAILDLNLAAAEQLASQLGPRAMAACGDVLDEEGLRHAEAAIGQRLPPPNGLVNCAGIAQVPTAIERFELKDWTRILESHLTGTYTSCRVFGSALASRGTGSIVNIASVLAFRPGPVLAYGAAKAAVVNLTEALSVHWARQGVRVNAVAPGWTDTPFLRPKERKGERDFTPILKATPMGRLMQPEEVAEVIHFLLSSAASAVTGATIPCDGGVIAGSGWAPYGGFEAVQGASGIS
jgi:NAD(P)-dependent dehydrogenase (short-subunit alcohol dehydrogenase family)